MERVLFHLYLVIFLILVQSAIFACKSPSPSRENAHEESEIEYDRDPLIWWMRRVWCMWHFSEIELQGFVSRWLPRSLSDMASLRSRGARRAVEERKYWHRETKAEIRFKQWQHPSHYAAWWTRKTPKNSGEAVASTCGVPDLGYRSLPRVLPS